MPNDPQCSRQTTRRGVAGASRSVNISQLADYSTLYVEGPGCISLYDMMLLQPGRQLHVT